MRTTRVLVVHPERLAAEAVSRRLDAEPCLRTVEITGTASSAQHAADVLGPDVLVVYLDGDERAVLDLTARLAQRTPPIASVVVLGNGNGVAAPKVIRAGARGVIAKDSPADELVRAVAAVASGEAWVSTSLLGAVIRELQSSVPRPNEYDERLARLTSREREVLDRLVAGCDRATIARDLAISLGTVRTHMRNILAKLEVHSSLEAASVARRGNGVAILHS